MTTSNSGFATPEELAAIQYGTRVSRPTTEQLTAVGSH
jgi:hypothetical protein